MTRTTRTGRARQWGPRKVHWPDVGDTVVEPAGQNHCRHRLEERAERGATVQQCVDAPGASAIRDANNAMRATGETSP